MTDLTQNDSQAPEVTAVEPVSPVPLAAPEVAETEKKVIENKGHSLLAEIVTKFDGDAEKAWAWLESKLHTI